MRPTIEDLERLAALNGVAIPRADLERIAASVSAWYQDLDRLGGLSLRGLEPAFTPEARAAEAHDAPAAAARPADPGRPDPGDAKRRDA